MDAMERFVIRNLIVLPDGRIVADEGPPPEAPDWYEIDAELRLVIFGYREKIRGQEADRQDAPKEDS